MSLVLEAPGSIPAVGEDKFQCLNMLSFVSFAGSTRNKCAVLRIGTLTGGHLCRESHPLCRLKNPTVVIWLLVGFHPAKPVCTMYTCSWCSNMDRKKEIPRRAIYNSLVGLNCFGFIANPFWKSNLLVAFVEV